MHEIVVSPVARAAIVVAIAITAAAAGPASAGPARVRHVPPADAEAGKPLELVASAPASSPQLAAYYRAPGATGYATLELVRRDAEHWVAQVPAAAVAAPGLEYYLAAGGAPVFASAEAPHRTRVAATADEARRARDLRRSRGHRSRVHAGGEWIDYGTREVDGRTLVDRYYRIDADFSYRLWAYPLEILRVGYTRLIGDTEAAACPGDDVPCTADAGFKVAGWFELGLAPLDGVALDGRAMVLATQAGFAVGGRAELRLGARDGTHIAAGGELMADVGSSGFFRFGWGTVRRAPMSATLEVTTLPATGRDAGVRLYYDVAGQLADNLRIGLRAGYAARAQTIAGFTGGVSATVDF